MNLSRMLFVSMACAASLPWLAPCTFGVGTIASMAVDNANQSVFHGSDVLTRLPNEQLKNWARRPGPLLVVRQNATVGRDKLIADHVVDRKLHSTPMTSHRGDSKVASGMSTLLALSDLMTSAFMEHGNNPDLGPAKTDRRQELMICESPYVVLHAQEIRWGATDGGKDVLNVRAGWRAKITVITPGGTYFGLAERIHYHAPSQEVILEGNPTVQSGHQHIKGEAQSALMKLNFMTRTVTVEGHALETRF